MNLEYAIDHIAILNRYAGYGHAVDSGNPDALVACFTPDATIDISSFTIARQRSGAALAKFMDQDGVIRGSENIRKSAGLGEFHHMTANVFIQWIDGDRAKGSVYFAVFTPDEGRVAHYGRYDDELLRCADGQWRFATRIDTALYERDRALPYGHRPVFL